MKIIQHSNIEALLKDVKDIIEKDKADKKQRGEDFNVFSVLQMESNETKTHSNMIAALLNPKGNHYAGSQFLERFLNQISYSYEGENLDEVHVVTEYYLGKINEDYTKGGYIDILITFNSGKTIAIENKIYAGDQQKQMYRYSLYNKGQSKLYYLNLFGETPSNASLNELSHEDYKAITYDNNIIKWLESCSEIQNLSAIVKTTIKQYLILIKQLTYTMDSTLEEQLDYIILNNLEAAKLIKRHYQRSVFKVREKFKKAIYLKLKEVFENSFDVSEGNDCNHKYSQIWINVKRKQRVYHFGIESFSGKGVNNNILFVGLLDRENDYKFLLEGCKRHNSYWPVVKDFKTLENDFLNLSSTRVLEKLGQDKEYFESMVGHVVNQAVNFISTYNSFFTNNYK